MSNLERIAKAGVDLKGISNEEKQVVESLTPEEVDTLIKAKQKVDAASKGKGPVNSLKII